MSDRSDKPKPKEVSAETRTGRDASRAGSDQAHADMPEHMEKSQKEKGAYEQAGLVPESRGPTTDNFGRLELSEVKDGEKVIYVAEAPGRNSLKDRPDPGTAAANADKADPYPSYTRGLEAARQSAKTPEEAAKAEIDFNQSYIERKLRASGKDPAELLQEHMKSQEPDQDDPAHGGTFKVPQNVAEKHDDGSVLLKINVSDNVQAEDRPPLTNSPDGWLEAGRRIAELPLDKQLQIIGSGLAAGINQYQHEENQRNWGRVIGTVQGIGEVSVNLAKIADFSAALILNDHDRAGKMGAEFGQSLGETIVGGVKLFNAADQYLFNIGFTGDYGKPFRDVVQLGSAMNEKWAALPPGEQERIKFKLLTELGADTLIGGGGLHSAGKAGKLTEFLDDVAGEMAKQGKKVFDGAKKRARVVRDAVEDYMLPDAVTPDGMRIKIKPAREAPDNAVYSQAHNPGGSDLPNPGNPPERASGQLSGRPEEPSPVRTGGGPSDHPPESPSHKPPQRGSHHDSPNEPERPADKPDHRESEDDIFKPRDMHQEIMDAIEVLDEPLKEFIEKYKVKIEIIEKMEDAFPGDVEKMKYLGSYDWGRNTIFVPKTVWHRGEYINNFDLDFAIRHEVGHAVNAKSLEKPNRFYSSPVRITDKDSFFMEAFAKDIPNVPSDVLRTLGFDIQTEKGLAFARDEVFADTFAHATGFPTKNLRSQLMRKYFVNTFKHMEGLHGV